MLKSFVGNLWGGGLELAANQNLALIEKVATMIHDGKSVKEIFKEIEKEKEKQKKEKEKKDDKNSTPN